MRPALDVYTDDLTGTLGGLPAHPLRARLRDGTLIRLPLERWLGPVSAVDDDVLTRARGPVIDLGCGPGRHLHALARRGVYSLGVDISPAAVALARGGGGRVIEASIFDQLPGAGSWRTALLLDGNIGIGGRPRELLARARSLLAPDGEILVELDGPAIATGAVEARIEHAGGVSDWFRWARVSARDADELAGAAGFRVTERWCSGARWFACLGGGMES
jgi:SAM-dependent methyltransferase